MIKIYNFPRAARGLRVAWQCEEMGLPYEVEAVSYPPSEAYLKLNRLGSVPFLEDEGGVALNESVAMMLYLAQKYGPTPLLPGKDDPVLARALQMTLFGETTLGMAMNPLIEARFTAPDEDKRNWSVRTQQARVEKALLFVEEMLGANSFLAGANFTLADISVCCALGMWRGAVGETLSDRLVAYREQLTTRPAYQRALASGGSR